MEILETVEVAADRNLTDLRFPVQYVNRPNLNFRGFAGTLASGVVHKGDEIVVLPSWQQQHARGDQSRRQMRDFQPARNAGAEGHHFQRR